MYQKIKANKNCDKIWKYTNLFNLQIQLRRNFGW